MIIDAFTVSPHLLLQVVASRIKSVSETENVVVLWISFDSRGLVPSIGLRLIIEGHCFSTQINDRMFIDSIRRATENWIENMEA